VSTAWLLAGTLRARGDDSEVVVLDKTGPGAGATGIACGVIRNNYAQPAMRRLMEHSVTLWEDHGEALGYRSVGYLQAAPEAMRPGVVRIHTEQQEIGYPSTLVEGEGDCRDYMTRLFPDWRAEGITVVLHEGRGGHADRETAVRGLARLAEAAGARILAPVQVTGLDLANGGVRAVHTELGEMTCDRLVAAAGPWTRDLWAMLGMPSHITVRAEQGARGDEVPMWTYWLVQEGVLRLDPDVLTDARGLAPPVVHVDSDAPLRDEQGALITEEMWGIYYKPDAHLGGVQGGAMPVRLEHPAEQVAVDPYGPQASRHVAGEDFAALWTAGLAHCHGRFAGCRGALSSAPHGGIGCFTPDSFPVFDTVNANTYVIADSNHGFKMVGVGALVARELLGEQQELLEPFRLSRFERGALHPVSASPFPWS
jgi:methylglutamate dehydrogenase subunit A